MIDSEDKSTFDVYLNKNVFILLKTNFVRNGQVTNVSKSLLTLLDKKIGLTSIDFDEIKIIEERK